VKIVGIDPGSERTGYGCVETDGRRHRLITCGAITSAAGDAFPDRLAHMYRELSALLARTRPECVAVEGVFHAVNPRSALKLGHARGVALLAAVEAGCTVVEYTPAEVKRAVVGYGRADKRQVQQMIKLLLGLETPPAPYDAADALAVAICHLHSGVFKAGLKTQARLETRVHDEASPSHAVEAGLQTRLKQTRLPRSWRQYRPRAHG
jgi:crossover junction endodeoxyribonuclease RuvC